MKKRYAAFLIAICALFLSSCSNAPCITDEWTWDNPYNPFCAGTRFEFREDGTASMIVPDCNNYCQGINPERGLVYNMSWILQESNNTFTLTFYDQGEICGLAYTHENPPAPIAGTLSCDGNAASLVTLGYTYNLTRE